MIASLPYLAVTLLVVAVLLAAVVIGLSVVLRRGRSD
jgi:hypothetical protein